MSDIKEKKSNNESSSDEQLYIFVRRQPNDYKTAKYKFEDFSGIHWANISGGIKSTFNKRYFIYGYVSPDEAIEGSVSYSGRHDYSKYGIKVCAVKKDNPTIIYNKLLEIAGENPNLSKTMPITNNRCKVDIIELLRKNKAMKYTDIREKLIEFGHGKTTVQKYMRMYLNEGIIKNANNKTTHGLRHNCIYELNEK